MTFQSLSSPSRYRGHRFDLTVLTLWVLSLELYQGFATTPVAPIVTAG